MFWSYRANFRRRRHSSPGSTANFPGGEIVLLAIIAASKSAKADAPTRGVVRHFDGLVKFFLDIRDDTKVALAGEQPVVLLRDYIESLRERGRTVPAAAGRALSVRADAPSID